MKETQKDMSFLEHLEVLRWHLIRSTLAVIFFTILSFLNKRILFDVIIFGPKKIDFFTYQIMCKISKSFNLGESLCLSEIPFVLINMSMPGQFTTHIWVSFIAGLIISMPYVLWEFWKFIKPALYDSEKKVAIILSSYPGREYQLAHAIGLDTIKSTEKLINFLCKEGFQGDLKEELLPKLRKAEIKVPIEVYKSMLENLPKSHQNKIFNKWGSINLDQNYRDGYPHLEPCRE